MEDFKYEYILGKNVSIESTIYQPYRRPEALVNDLKDAWEKVGEFFTSDNLTLSFFPTNSSGK